MIKFENGKVKATGTGAQMCMELSLLIKDIERSIADETSDEFAEERIKEAFENSKLSEEEIVKKFRNQTEGVDKEITGLLVELLAELLHKGGI